MNKRKLIRYLLPQIQGRLLVFLAMTAVVSVMLQAALLTYTLTQVARSLPHDGTMLHELIPATLVRNSLLTLAIALPVLLVLGAAATMPLVGPLYRFRMYLQAVADGRETQRLRLRAGDSFHDVAELINAATALQREHNGQAQTATAADVTEEAEPSRAAA